MLTTFFMGVTKLFENQVKKAIQKHKGTTSARDFLIPNINDLYE
jgi:hypothetical protein